MTDDLFEAMDATWPAAALHRAGDWLLREGRGGGKRVSAASTVRPDADIATMGAAQQALGQPALAMIRPGQEALDARLEAAGYRVVDPVLLMAGPVDAVAEGVLTPVTAFDVWPPLAIQRDLWAEQGIGPERLAVMARVAGDRTAILGRIEDRAAGAAFVACAGDLAMVHAVEVLPAWRRRGLARQMMRAAAQWAQARGCARIALAVTRGNAPARALYAGLGLEIAGAYHYRLR